MSRAAVINAMIHGLIAEKVAAANKITITDGERDALIKDSNLAGLLNVPKGRPSPTTWPISRLFRARSAARLTWQLSVSSKSRSTPASVCWIPHQKTIITDQSASLAEPAPTPTP